jgi:hypothetical protein
MAVTTKGFSHLIRGALEFLTIRTYVRIIVSVKMGVGGMSAKTSYRLEDLARALDLHIRLTNERIEDELARIGRLRRARRQVELRMWRTSPLFCKPR